MSTVDKQLLKWSPNQQLQPPSTGGQGQNVSAAAMFDSAGKTGDLPDTNSQFTTPVEDTYLPNVRIASYIMNRDIMVGKKINACDRSAIELSLKGGNAVIKTSAAAFEVIRSTFSVDTADQDVNHFFNTVTSKQDLSGQIEQDIITVHNVTKKGRKGKYLYTVNMFRTTSTIMVNGPGMNKFVTEVYPKLEEKLKMIDIPQMDKQLKKTLESFNDYVDINQNDSKIEKKKENEKMVSVQDNMCSSVELLDGHIDTNQKSNEAVQVQEKRDSEKTVPVQENMHPTAESLNGFNQDVTKTGEIEETKDKGKTVSKECTDDNEWEDLPDYNTPHCPEYHDRSTPKKHRPAVSIRNKLETIEQMLAQINGLTVRLSDHVDRLEKTMKTKSELAQQGMSELKKTLTKLEKEYRDSNAVTQKRIKLLEKHSEQAINMEKEIVDIKAYCIHEFGNIEKTIAKDNVCSKLEHDRFEEKIDSIEAENVALKVNIESIILEKNKEDDKIRVTIEKILSEKNQENSVAPTASEPQHDKSTTSVTKPHGEAKSEPQHDKSTTSVTKPHGEAKPVNINKQTNNRNSVTLLCDSTGSNININRMIPNNNGNKIPSPNLRSVQQKLESIPQSRGKIIIQCGVNDIPRFDETGMVELFREVTNTAKEFHPTADIYLCSILPDRDDVEQHKRINQFIESHSSNRGIGFINLTPGFLGNRNLYRDRRHPNYNGTATIAKTFKQTLGIGVGTGKRITNQQSGSPSPRFLGLKNHNRGEHNMHPREQINCDSDVNRSVANQSNMSMSNTSFHPEMVGNNVGFYPPYQHYMPPTCPPNVHFPLSHPMPNMYAHQTEYQGIPFPPTNTFMYGFGPH